VPPSEVNKRRSERVMLQIPVKVVTETAERVPVEERRIRWWSTRMVGC